MTHLSGEDQPGSLKRAVWKAPLFKGKQARAKIFPPGFFTVNIKTFFLLELDLSISLYLFYCNALLSRQPISLEG